MPQRKQAVTIKHVAADAGVSLQTVSRVVNKEPNVRPGTIARVQASIAKLGYVPSIAAQRMGGSRSRLIVALNDRERTIEDWKSGAGWVDQMLLGGMLTAAEHGYRIVVELVDTHSDHIERELSAAIAALQPDGVILTPPHSGNPLITQLLARRQISFARIGSLAGGPGFALTMDDERAARVATEHLLELGHRRIGFVAGPSDYDLSQWRVDGWRAALAGFGAVDDALLVRGNFGYASGASAAARLLDLADPPTAIIASSDQMTIAALETARGRGLAVPDDLSLVSFDDTPIVRYTHPPLTAVVQPIAGVSAAAVSLIIAEQIGRPVPDGATVVPAGFIQRASTAPPRGGPRG